MNHLHGSFLPGYLWPVILLCLALTLYLVDPRVLPCVCTFARQDGHWRKVRHFLWGGTPSVMVMQGAVLYMYVVRNVSDFENEEYVILYLLSGLGLASPPSCYFGVPVHRGETPAAQPGAHLSPASQLFIYRSR